MLHNFGSINLDHFYRVPHLVSPGETLSSHDYRVGLGGKGANQSLAVARAGGQVAHWGRLGRQDAWARDILSRAGVHVSNVELVDAPSGHAIIQVDDRGENAIILCPGANHGFSRARLADLIDASQPGDWLLTQNECNALPELMEEAHKAGLQIAFNPAPMTDDVRQLPLDACDLLFLNRGEAAWLAGIHDACDAEQLLSRLQEQRPDTATVLTLGGDGAWYQRADTRHYQPAIAVSPVDTTGAGDTFIGYFLAAHQADSPIERCLEIAATAAALSVMQPGAAESIPRRDAVDHALSHGISA